MRRRLAELVRVHVVHSLLDAAQLLDRNQAVFSFESVGEEFGLSATVIVPFGGINLLGQGLAQSDRSGCRYIHAER